MCFQINALDCCAVNGMRSFHGLMQRLAAVALLLMLLAPLISRWQQAHSATAIDDPLLCQSEAHAHTHHANTNSLTNHHSHTDHHDDHGIACDYCVLITRLLPLLVWLWLFPTLLCTVAPNLHLASLAPQATYWPAPHPRGPPRYS